MNEYYGISNEGMVMKFLGGKEEYPSLSHLIEVSAKCLSCDKTYIIYKTRKSDDSLLQHCPHCHRPIVFSIANQA